MRRFGPFCALLAVFTLLNVADAGNLMCRVKCKIARNACCAPACCEPAACEPAACEPAACEPACCEPRCGLLAKLKARKACCAPACCEPVGEEAEPAPAAPPAP